MRLATEAAHPYVKDAIAAIVRRAHAVGKGAGVRDFVEAELKRKVDLWQKQAQRTEGGRRLGYREKADGVTVNLLRKPGLERWEEFTCPNSLREVEPTVNLVLDDRNIDVVDGDPTDSPSGSTGSDDGGLVS
jgi:hypothetical protein